MILADCDFNNTDSVGMVCSQGKIPNFMKEKQNLSISDIVDTFLIADHVIGSVIPS